MTGMLFYQVCWQYFILYVHVFALVVSNRCVPSVEQINGYYVMPCYVHVSYNPSMPNPASHS